jgi:predicted ATPase/class 3 adenylate cyclase
MDDNASFGYWVRRQRKALDLTQAELARRVGCAEGTIRMIEADARRPSRQIAARLAEQLAITPADHGAFIRAARAELCVDRLAPPVQYVSPAPSPIAPDLPSGTVTFLFTDIEGSTALWEQYPQTMPIALAQHTAILRAAIAAHGGMVFKTVGDAACAAFAAAPAALMAALAAQRALYTEPWGATGPLRVRMALHTGSVEVRDGDYTGLPLSRLARLLVAGHGGQTLLSLATTELVRERMPLGAELRDLGEHRLKDLTRPERIFQLVAADLPTDFPPLNSLERHRHNLPTQLTRLIGREREVAQVCSWLRSPEVRLLTLSGPGGSGKTRLALQAAAELLDDFLDGVFFVDLAPISDPDLVAGAIAQAFGIREAAGRSLLDRLNDYLLEKHILLLLDNFEQVSPAAPAIADLLAAAPRLKVLVTSRAVLHLYGEREFAVPPLETPEHGRLPAPDRLTQYEAVRLFVERARAVTADFVITNANAPAVAEICERLDGLPLAIELAAARLKLLAPQALLERLERRLPLLTGGAQNLPARQQTLRRTIDWSYHLLDVGEQTLFRRLGVFVGGCSLEAVEVVCSATQGIPGDIWTDTLDGLTALVDKSLLRQEAGTDGAPRFMMLETIREYALERLVASGEEAALRQQHAQYYLALAERAEPLLHGAEQRRWLNRLEVEHDNLRAVLVWNAVTVDGIAVGMRLASALGYFWTFGGYLTEGREHLARILAQSESIAPTAARVRALYWAGHLAGAQGDFDLASTLLTESRTLSQEIGYEQGLAYAVQGLGFVAWLRGDYLGARAQRVESLRLFRELGERWAIAQALRFLASSENSLADYERAVALLEESLPLFRELGDQVNYGHVLLDRGYAARLQGDNARAAACYAESLALFRNLGYVWGIAAVQLASGYLAQAQGAALQAAACFAESLVRYREIGHREGISLCLAGSAGAAGSLGQPLRAARLFGAAEGLRALIGMGAIEQPIERAAYEESVVSVRAQLDPESFAAAWAAGRAMSLEQAIADAREGGDVEPVASIGTAASPQ